MTALPADLIVRPAHLCLVLNLESRSLIVKIMSGEIPSPDGRGHAGLKLWTLDTIRRWNSTAADDLEALFSIPRFKPRPQRYRGTPLLNAA